MSESPYRAPTPPDPWLVAWKDLSKRRMRRWIAFWAWMPVLVVLRWYDVANGWAALVIALVFLLHPHHFACPRCGKLFEERGPRWLPWYLPFTRRCVWCRLAVGTARGREPSETSRPELRGPSGPA